MTSFLPARRHIRTPSTTKTPHLDALKDAAPRPFWFDNQPAPEPCSALTADTTADLVIIGGGYTGLWAALQAKENDPTLDVVLIEADTCGSAASGRNGGFCASSLTHGILNGIDRFEKEMPELEKQGLENLDEIEAAVKKYGIDCDFQRSGELDVATEPWQLDELARSAMLAEALGHDVALLDAAETRAEVNSPTYLGALYMPRSVAMLDPARLAWGLREACLELGVRIYEWTKALELDEVRNGIEVRTPYGKVRAARGILATNGFPPLLKRLKNYIVPVYDYVLVTEPLTQAQLDSIGWKARQGVGDSANQFHYYRLTEDNRILWGGYDAIYYYGGPVRSELTLRADTYAVLADHFFETFPQLAGIKFTHRWGGVIDTCSRFCPFVGTAMGGRLGYALGFTGLGVGATRFAAGALLDQLYGRYTDRSRLHLMNSKPLPLPPEPFRWIGIQLTRWSLNRADANSGRRNLWLRTLDRCGLGFDS
ncbi:Glycine/D-amino acid oxidase [Amycolatopsis xylanica]|uniref:Glycine/D-amino acid oxidase n=1 Tax=Amycolatopsis xylanica TaxID=589385 RepID=A0A1H2ZT62_9PSEU|nr:FAD-dependent oxidoreductase [Amycolatopsis xylanica]SDX20782.1 Glycine/D-amino acid oxidase [Amycolatopsis xylanica]